MLVKSSKTIDTSRLDGVDCHHIYYKEASMFKRNDIVILDRVTLATVQANQSEDAADQIIPVKVNGSNNWIIYATPDRLEPFSVLGGADAE